MSITHQNHTKKLKTKKMATMNANVLAFNYAVSGAVVSQDINSPKPATVGFKPLVIRSQKTVSQTSETKDQSQQGRRAALLCLGAALFATATSSANAGVIDEYLEKSKANKVSSIFLCMSIITNGFSCMIKNLCQFF